MRVVTRASFLVLSLLAVAACATGGGSTGSTESSGDAGESALVRVDNRSTYLMTVYVVRSSGSRRRLGQVRSLSTATFTLPDGLVFGVTPLRFQADPVGIQRAPISSEITVVPGDTVTLTIPPF